MTHRHLCFLILAWLWAGLAGPVTGTEIEVSSSYPAIFELTPPGQPEDEGVITVTARADQPIAPLEALAWLQQEDESTWFTAFAWSDSLPREARFLDAGGDTHTVVFAPELVMPYEAGRHALPVLQIETAPANLWDPETGIYVWGLYDNFLQRGSEWERPATLTYRDADGNVAFTEPIGLRINGQSSREYDQKGLRIYFDDYGSQDHVEYDFFGDGPIRCERLVLRSSRYVIFPISSGLTEPLHRELGHPGSRLAFVAVYLNGEYWGAYSLRERLDSKWVETTHEWADDDYVVIKDHEAEEGDYARWEAVLAGCQPPGEFDSHAWFQWLEGQLDPASYIDWLLINAFGETADNMHGKNMALVKIGGAPFDFMTWDEDILFQSQNRTADHLSFFASGDPAEFLLYQPPLWYSGGPWPFTFEWNNLLRAGMQNAQFKALLRERAAALLAGPLSSTAMNARLDQLQNVQEPEWANHRERWSHGGLYASAASSVRLQFGQRQLAVTDQVAAFLATWAQPVELSAFSLETTAEGIVLAWHSEREEDIVGWVVERSVDGGVSFQPIADHLTHPQLVSLGGPETPADYSFTDTTAPAGAPLAYRLAHAAEGGQITVLPWVESLVTSLVFNLRLNELMASNDTTIADGHGEFDDWAELHNPGPEPVSLAGLFMTDNLSNPIKWALPDLEMAPGEFLLVWCDEDLEQGPLHASFKLGAGGEELGLFAGHDQDNAPIDTVEFGAQATDVSYGREVDGTGAWVVLPNPTPGLSNTAVSAVETDIRPTGLHLGPAWPNPATGSVRISASLPQEGEGATRLRVYDLRGALVRELNSEAVTGPTRSWTWDGRDQAGQRVSTGVYLLQWQAGSITSRQRVVLLR